VIEIYGFAELRPAGVMDNLTAESILPTIWALAQTGVGNPEVFWEKFPLHNLCGCGKIIR